MRRYSLQEDDQLYFLHIAKTGGMSLIKTIQKFIPSSEDPHYRPRLLLNPPESLRKQRFIVGHTFYMIRHFLDREPLYLTMLREPVSHVISHYRHIRRVERHPLHELFKNATLLEFLASPEGTYLSTNGQTVSIGIDDDPRVFMKQNEGITIEMLGPKMREALHARMDERAMLELVKSRVQNFAFIGLTDRFADSVYLLNYTFHWEPSSEIVHFHRDPQRPAEIPEEAREIIRERTQLDAQLYEFGLELFEQRRRDMIFDLLETDHKFSAPEMTETSRSYSADMINLPQESSAAMKDNQGWEDGWVGPRWVLSGMALPSSIKTLEVSGKTLAKQFKTPLKLTVLVGGKPVQQVEVGRRGKFSLRIPLTGATVEILADQYFIPAQLGISADHRPLSWLIERMNLK